MIATDPGTVVPELETRALHKRLGTVDAVAGVDLRVEAGQVVGLVGPNGAGKTTLMHLIAGLLDPSSGSIDVGGRGAPTRASVRATIGFAPQPTAVYDDLTVLENLQFFGKLFGLDGALLSARVEECVRFARLETRAKDRAGTLSGGMRRRLHVAAAAVHSPRLLLLDEPTTGVDRESRAHLVECVKSLRARGCGVLYASHHLDEISLLCDRVVVLGRGRVVHEGPAASADLEGLLRSVE